jgi:FkbM family methyltransferase
VVDIGANRGQFALICREWFPKARIDSFEPLREPCEGFQDIFRGNELVTLHQIAIGAKETETIIHVSNQDHSSSLLPISEKQTRLFPGTIEKETRSIHVCPLEKVFSLNDIELPALLKIDVQGLELEVLKGCGSLLDVFNYVYVECSFVELYSNQALAHEVISFLSEKGFNLSGIYNTYHDAKGRSVQADFLFTKK